MAFLVRSTGEVVTKKQSHENTGGGVIPAKTPLNVYVESVKWDAPSQQEVDEGDDNDHINIMWRVYEGPYEGRVVFQKMRVLSSDGKRRDNALDFYATTDTVLNEGLLLEMGEEPTDEELTQAWADKRANIIVDVWHIGKGKDKKEGGNYVTAICAVGASGSTTSDDTGGRRRRRAAPADEPAPEPQRTRRTRR